MKESNTKSTNTHIQNFKNNLPRYIDLLERFAKRTLKITGRIVSISFLLLVALFIVSLLIKVIGITLKFSLNEIMESFTGLMFFSPFYFVFCLFGVFLWIVLPCLLALLVVRIYRKKNSIIEGDLESLLTKIPNKVSWNQVVDLENMDDRISATDVLYANTIGVSKGFIEFCPDNSPPLKEEKLSWIWCFRPDLSDELLKLKLSEDFEFLIRSYQQNKMEDFWDKLC